MKDRHDEKTGPARRHHLRWLWGVSAMVAIIATVGAACGGSSGPSVASVGSSSPTASASPVSSSTSGSSPLAFSQCMRAHGIEDFPDPNPQGGFGLSSKGDLNLDNPTFQRAQKACQSLAGSHGTAAQEAADGAKLLKYAECMRSHGVTNFPDPVHRPDGGYGFNINGPALDQTGPTYRAANQVCVHLAPGDHGA